MFMNLRSKCFNFTAFLSRYFVLLRQSFRQPSKTYLLGLLSNFFVILKYTLMIFQAILKLKETGRVRHVGVSNVNEEQLARLCAVGKPACLQVCSNLPTLVEGKVAKVKGKVAAFNKNHEIAICTEPSMLSSTDCVRR